MFSLGNIPLALSNMSPRCFGIQESTYLRFAEMYLTSRLSSRMNEAAGDISLWIVFPFSQEGRSRSSSTP